jgi:hypothetical protein
MTGQRFDFATIGRYAQRERIFQNQGSGSLPRLIRQRPSNVLQLWLEAGVPQAKDRIG